MKMTKAAYMTTTVPRFTALSLALVVCSACSDESDFDQGQIASERQTPEQPGPVLDVAPYTANNTVVREAQSLYYDGFSLHANVIRPTCGPINGVCHNSKEFPDLHTPANFVGAIGAPCNIQSGTPAGIFDRCERPGDRLRLGDGQADIEIGYLEYLPGEYDGDSPEADSPGLHIYLAGKVSSDGDSIRGDAQFFRAFVNDDGNVQDLPYFRFGSRFWILADSTYEFGDEEEGTHLFARVANYQQRDIEALLSVGVVEGDANHNGTLGARVDGNPIQIMKRGRPEESYLVGRMRGVLANEPVPGSRMPLANEPLNNTEMLALYCFLEGLEDRSGPVNMQDPIDYKNCSYASRPEQLELLGAGVSWGGRIKRILEFNCGGCHGGDTVQADLNLVDGDVFARVLQASAQLTALKLIEPGQPMQSYLWLKISGDPSIVGAPMPIDPLNGDRRLSAQELADIKTWIEEGALPGGEETPLPSENDSSVPDPSDTMDSGTGTAMLDAGSPEMQDAGSPADAEVSDSGQIEQDSGQ